MPWKVVSPVSRVHLRPSLAGSILTTDCGWCQTTGASPLLPSFPPSVRHRPPLPWTCPWMRMKIRAPTCRRWQAHGPPLQTTRWRGWRCRSHPGPGRSSPLTPVPLPPLCLLLLSPPPSLAQPSPSSRRRLKDPSRWKFPVPPPLLQSPPLRSPHLRLP
jgi:hypothetical protein